MISAPEAFDMAMAVNAEKLRSASECMYEKLVETCDSEIERILAAALLTLPSSAWGDNQTGSPLDSEPTVRLKLASQYQIGQFRADFAVFPDPAQKPPLGVPVDAFKIAIECDGHAWHQARKDQVERDHRRNAFFQTRGWKIVRFPGSRIVRDPFGCADEIADLIESAFSTYYNSISAVLAVSK